MNDPFANVPCLDVDPEIFYPGEWRAPSSADDALATTLFEAHTPVEARLPRVAATTDGERIVSR